MKSVLVSAAGVICRVASRYVVVVVALVWCDSGVVVGALSGVGSAVLCCVVSLSGTERVDSSLCWCGVGASSHAIGAGRSAVMANTKSEEDGKVQGVSSP